MTTIFAPHLFVRNISKNVTKDSLWEVFSNLGFGVIENIVVKPRAVKNNAIVYFQQWAMDETAITRNMLQEGRALSITHEDDGSIWKVCAFDEMRCGSVRNYPERLLPNVTGFPERLLPNVTDNRAERERNAGYAVEFLDDLRNNLFPLDNITNAPVKAERSTSLCNDRDLDEIVMNMTPLFLDEPVSPVANNVIKPFAIDYGEVRIPPKRRVIKK
jgi:hypothetical protein